MSQRLRHRPARWADMARELLREAVRHHREILRWRGTVTPRTRQSDRAAARELRPTPAARAGIQAIRAVRRMGRARGQRLVQAPDMVLLWRILPSPRMASLALWWW